MPVTQRDVISTTLNYVKIIHYSQTLCPNPEEEAAAGDFVLVLCLEILCIIECNLKKKIKPSSVEHVNRID